MRMPEWLIRLLLLAAVAIGSLMVGKAITELVGDATGVDLSCAPIRDLVLGCG